MPGLDLVHVTKSYGRATPAVSDVSLRVEDGELLVLVGPSGCGKTTLLRLIAGLEKATEGDVAIAGRVVNDLPPKDRDIEIQAADRLDFAELLAQPSYTDRSHDLSVPPP